MCDLRYTPRLRPSASMMAIVLKNTCPARSKKLMGSTTPSSRATALKWRTARFSSTGQARFRCRLSCSMQKYGASNNSGSRMICAPRPAASRTSFSALAMLPATFQSQDICVAATVTWRGLRRKWSGSVDIDDFSRIENAAWIERGFQGAHGRNFGARARDFKIRFAFEADSVLGGDGARDAAQRLVDALFNRANIRIAGASWDVQNAVSDVPEYERTRIRKPGPQRS